MFYYAVCTVAAAVGFAVAVAPGAVVTVIVVAVAVDVVVVAAAVDVVAATDHRRQCSRANQAPGANFQGSQQSPFAKRKGGPTA